MAPIDELRCGPVLGVDLNDDHLAAYVLDGSGNPVGKPITIPLHTAGLPATQRDGRVRAAITALLDAAAHAGGHRAPRLRRRTCDRPRNDRPRHAGETVPAHRGWYPHREIPDPPDRDGGPPRHRGHRRRSGLNQQMGRPTLGQTPTTTDFRTGHPPPRRGGRDRQTSPRTGDQATAGRTPQRTADRYGHATGQARPPAQPRWQARQFRPTATHTMGCGPPENTRHQRPTPSGPQPSRTHSCSLMRNGIASHTGPVAMIAGWLIRPGCPRKR
ncbi:MAG: hypothetical protein QOH27_506 [Mycobacterium sp.]|nr:hypothetical protein [Mycobacterium sp.]MDT7754608.1 hypothetical protein [Mycobacterium sp.]